MPVTQIVTALANSGGPPPTPTPVGSYIWNTTSIVGYAYTGGTTPTVQAYQYANNTNGAILSFNGAGWLETASVGTFTDLSMDFWFKPTANNVAIISMTETPGAENSGYHYNMVEIDSSGNIHAGVWNGANISSTTSNTSVNLNAWNHFYFYYNSSSGAIHLELNGPTDTTNVLPVTYSGPTANTFFGIGMSDATRMVTSGRYQGYMDWLYINTSSIEPSRYMSTKAQYGL